MSIKDEAKNAHRFDFISASQCCRGRFLQLVQFSYMSCFPSLQTVRPRLL